MSAILCLDFSHCQATTTSDDVTGLAVLHYLEQQLTFKRGLELKPRHFYTIYVLTIHVPFQFFFMAY